MKLLLLRVLLQKRARDEGFTLPMVIALGLVMILLGTTSIVKSSEENLNATIQNSSSDALAVAEVGITKYREFLNRNRFLTVQNDERWTTVAGIANQTCDVITTTPNGWNDGGTAAAPNDTSKWWRIEEDLDSNAGTPDDFIGEYQFVDYTYDINNNTSSNDNNRFAQNDDEVNTTDDFTYNNTVYNPRGLLTVKGRSPDGSEAQIEVEIPLKINQGDLENLAPALWINNRGTYINSLASNLGNNLTLPAGNNVVLSTAASSSGCTDPADLTVTSGSINVVADPRRLPSVNYIRDTLIPNATSASRIQDDTDLLDITDNRIGRTGHDAYKEPVNGGTFSANDCSNIDNCRYYYNLGSSPVTLDKNTYTDGIAKATLYIDSDLTIDKVDVGSSISSSYFEIYVNGSRTVTIDTGSAGNTIEIDALIHAPASRLDITGSGNVIFRGSLWVNRLFNSTTGTVTIDVDDTRSSSRESFKSYNYYTTTLRRAPRPLTGAPTNWTTEEVQ